MAAAIRTPDQRLRVFVSSTLGELAAERAAVRAAIERLRLTPVMFELGARPHPPRDLYRSYLEQSDVFVGIYGESYGWVAPEMEISGLEDEYLLSQGKPALIYVKDIAPHRDRRLIDLIDRIESEARVSYKTFSDAEQLAEQLSDDLAILLTERFAATAGELPSGTVTMLFTDIEGSTQLVRSLGKRYPDVLNEHHRLLRETFAAHDGHEIGSEGDSFFVVFRRTTDALEAAVDAQRALALHSWPQDVEVRVRMGLHTGEPALGGEGYVGLGVHRAARIAAAGHGGQVLVSETTRHLLEGEELPGVALRDLGPQLLKDFEQPQRLYQLVVEGLPADFPPLKTLAAQEAAELPFVGQERELAEAAREAVEREVRRRTRRHVGIGAGAVLAAVGAALGLVFALSGGRGGIVVGANAVGVIDAKSNEVRASVPVGSRPGDISFGSGSIWVANLGDDTVTRVDPKTDQAVRAIPVGVPPSGLAAGEQAVWVASNDGSVRRIDPTFGVVRTVNPGRKAFLAGPIEPSPITVGDGAVWLVNHNVLVQIDPANGKAASRTDVGFNPAAVAVGEGAAWVTDNAVNSVTRVARNGSTTSIPVGNLPNGIAVGEGGVWVADSQDDSVLRIDPSTRVAVRTIPVGVDPTGIAVGAGAVWVANARSGTVSRIDPKTNRVVKTIEVGNSPTAVTVAGGRVWVTVQQSAAGPLALGGKGGVVRIAIASDAGLGNADPAVANTSEAWQLLDATCAKLLDYPDKAAPAGLQLVPEVAKAMPRMSDGGTTYSFTIRPGYRFSPPSNQPVTAQTFKYSIERALNPLYKESPQFNFMADVVGVRAFESGKSTHISGVVAKGDTLTIRLTRPAGSLPALLASPYFCAVPIGTPISARGVPAIPMAGPYYLSLYVPGQRLVLKRNPNYGGSRPHRLAAIDYSIGASPTEILKEVESGRIDYAATSAFNAGIPVKAIPGLRARYGAASPVAGAGRQRFFENPTSTILVLWMNTKRPLFRSVRMRKAVEYAIDREALTAEVATTGGGRPTDQYLPPLYPGFTDARIYPFHPDLAKARALAAGHGGVAVLYAFAGSQSIDVVTKDLATIGITVIFKKYPIDQVIRRFRRSNEPYDLFLGGYAGSYPDPANVLDTSIEAGMPIGGSRFDDPTFLRKVAEAARLTGPERYRVFGRLDVELARDYAPAATYSYETVPDFFSARVGCETYQPVFGMDLVALCLRPKK